MPIQTQIYIIFVYLQNKCSVVCRAGRGSLLICGVLVAVIMSGLRVTGLKICGFLCFCVFLWRPTHTSAYDQLFWKIERAAAFLSRQRVY